MNLSQNYIKLILGLKIKQLRQEKNLSLQQLSDKCGLSVSYLNEIESGKKYPKSNKIAHISNALGISYDKLISLKLTKQLAPIGELFESNIFEQLPLDHYGINIQKFVSLMSKASLQLSALVSTIIEMGKGTEQSDNNFSRSALRAYKEFNENYFESLENDVDKFIKENKLNPTRKINITELENILINKYSYKINYDKISAHSDLTDQRAFLKKGKQNILFVNKNLSEPQKNFILSKEIAYNYLKYHDRSLSHSSKRLKNFDHLLNNLKASYFATALIINKNIFINDLKMFFNNKKWEENYFIQLIEKYNVTPEMLFQRICNLASKYFGLNKFFFYRFSSTSNGESFSLSKEVRLNISKKPGEIKSFEHYCRRWLSIKIIKKLIDEEKNKKNTILTGILHSKFYNSNDEFLSISISKKNNFAKDEYYSVTIGFQFDDKLKSKIAFCEDKNIPVEVVNDSCEMCLISDCKVRIAEPISINKIEKEKRIEEILSNLSD